MNNVICVKWGTKYGPEYVNILAAMVRRNLQTPYRFVCFTDDATGFDSRIEVRPLPEIKLSTNFPLRAWRKQTVFREKLDDLEGTALFLDLDVVILSDLQPFFDHPGRFLIVHEWGFRDPVIGNSSVFRFEIGQHADQFNHFVNHTDEVRGQYRNEQAYTSHSMHKKGILEYWPKEWCLSFKRHCMRSFPINYFLAPDKPENAKIVIFHGNPNPDAARDGWTGHYGLRHVRPTKWIGEAWNE
ncbi:MAG: hypothetical protein FWC43_01805 [Planctomycetaceae bacterium]|nr:hypothetical protein [Planctomycetaceae bacterium]